MNNMDNINDINTSVYDDTIEYTCDFCHDVGIEIDNCIYQYKYKVSIEELNTHIMDNYKTHQPLISVPNDESKYHFPFECDCICDHNRNHNRNYNKHECNFPDESWTTCYKKYISVFNCPRDMCEECYKENTISNEKYSDASLHNIIKCVDE